MSRLLTFLSLALACSLIDGATLQLGAPDGKEITFNTSATDEEKSGGGNIQLTFNVNGDFILGGRGISEAREIFTGVEHTGL